MTLHRTENLHSCVGLEHAPLNTAVCQANHLAITAVMAAVIGSYI